MVARGRLEAPRSGAAVRARANDVASSRQSRVFLPGRHGAACAHPDPFSTKANALAHRKPPRERIARVCVHSRARAGTPTNQRCQFEKNCRARRHPPDVVRVVVVVVTERPNAIARSTPPKKHPSHPSRAVASFPSSHLLVSPSSSAASSDPLPHRGIFASSRASFERCPSRARRLTRDAGRYRGDGARENKFSIRLASSTRASPRRGVTLPRVKRRGFEIQRTPSVVVDDSRSKRIVAVGF